MPGHTSLRRPFQSPGMCMQLHGAASKSAVGDPRHPFAIPSSLVCASICPHAMSHTCHTQFLLEGSGSYLQRYQLLPSARFQGVDPSCRRDLRVASGVSGPVKRPTLLSGRRALLPRPSAVAERLTGKLRLNTLIASVAHLSCGPDCWRKLHSWSLTQLSVTLPGLCKHRPDCVQGLRRMCSLTLPVTQ